jgi:hypothetical protein
VEAPVSPPLPVPAKNGAAILSLVLGITALLLLVGSFGFAFPLTLPLAVTAWGLGREARRSGVQAARGAAVAGEALGIAGTAIGVLLLGGCATLLAGGF